MKTRFFAYVCMITTLVLTVTPALAADDDGGGRSMFAFGAGNRALGLGGAFAALANDASASLWNPGGLGFVTRSEIQFSQTSYYGFDMQEQYASLAFPNWKWGVGALTFRRFGVGGIEQRDDRNALLSTDLSNNETEFAIGYGRSFGDTWGVGGVLKFRHQSLAGFAGGGIGIDIGVLARPLLALYPENPYGRRLSMGFAIRNVIEPEIRLASESVPDPIGVRFGTAYLFPFLNNRTLLASLDLEQTEDMDLRLHSGLEVNVHPLLTLRAGVNDGSFTAGSGMMWNGVSVDYTFEQNDIEDVHRIGASFAFGQTVEQSRQASIDRYENELQSRLAEAFEARQKTRVRELLVEADAEKAQGNHDAALEILAVVSALEPGNIEASMKQAACYREIGARFEADSDFAGATVSYSRALGIMPDDALAKAGYERCSMESNRLAARSEQLRRQFASALDAFSVHDLGKARDGFAAILKVNPNDTEAREMHRRTLKAIDYRVASLLEQASRMVDWGHHDEAAASLAHAKRLDPKANGIDRVEAKLKATQYNVTNIVQNNNTSDSTTTTVSDDTSVRPLSEDKKREAEELYKRAVAAMSQNASDKAIQYLELVWTIDKNYKRTAEHLKREYMTRGMEYFADGNFDKAVTFWESALRIDPTDERTKGYLSRAREQASRTREILGKSK